MAREANLYINPVILVKSLIFPHPWLYWEKETHCSGWSFMLELL
jgi:hypothetical protein